MRGFYAERRIPADVERTSFSELSPQTLLGKGYEFTGNLPADNSLRENQGTVDLELVLLSKQLKDQGLSIDETTTRTWPAHDPIRDLDSFKKVGLKDGRITTYLKGRYDAAAGVLNPDPDKVAAFQKFQFDKFITNKDPKQLLREGYKFVCNLPLRQQDDGMVILDPTELEQFRNENKQAENLIREQSALDRHVQLVTGHYQQETARLSNLSMVAVFAKYRGAK